MLIGTVIKKCMFDGVQHLLLLSMYQMVLSKVVFYPQCFFKVYIDQLSIRLNGSGIGRDIGRHLINHLFYADDLCLISLSSARMQSLLDICNSYATEHVLTYNSRKSYSLCFKPKYIKFNRSCFCLNRLEISRIDQCKYLGNIICTKNCDIDFKRQMRKFYGKL